MHSRDSLIIATFKYYCFLQETAKDSQYWSLQTVLLIQHWDRQGDGTMDLDKTAHLNTSGALLRDVDLPEAVIGTSVHIVYSIPCYMRLVTTTLWSNPSQPLHQLMAPLKLHRTHPRTLSLPSPWTCHASGFLYKNTLQRLLLRNNSDEALACITFLEFVTWWSRCFMCFHYLSRVPNKLLEIIITDSLHVLEN